MVSEAGVGPVRAAERIAFWDVLRGVAVLGILVANIPYMALASMIANTEGYHAGGDAWSDYAAFYFTYLFADTKFVTIYSFLFGVGFAWMCQRAQQVQRPYAGRYARRLGVLLVIGVVHGVVIWFGDILTTYALLGFVAMLFRNCRARTLLIWFAVLFALNGVLWALFGMVDPADFVEREEGQTAAAAIAAQLIEYREVFASGDSVAMLGHRAEIFLTFLPQMLVFFGLRTLGLFLLGMAAVRSGAFVWPNEHRRLFGSLLVFGMVFGLILMAASAGMHALAVPGVEGAGPRTAQMVLLYFGGFALSCGYVGWVARWCRSSWLPGLRARVAAIGRMGLTSYLSHSVITAVVFNYAGFYDAWRRPYLLLIVLAIYMLQLWFSPWWLRRFRYGPVEWLWRSLTYGARQPILVRGTGETA